MLFNTAAEQQKLDFQNKLNQVFPEVCAEIESEGVEIRRGYERDINIWESEEIIGSINLEWAAMGKLRVDGVMSSGQQSRVFRLLRHHGLAH